MAYRAGKTGVQGEMSFNPVVWVYMLIQWVLEKLFAPTPPPPKAHLRRPRVAVVGAGLTGVAAAAHIVGHGFDVTIFEAGDENSVGGIWRRVNNTSSLQIHSLMYRFHPSVRWDKGYPDRQEIVTQITKLWTTYGLNEKTRFNTRVESVKKTAHGRWIINGETGDLYDGIVAAVGTCGEPKMPHIPNQEAFKGEIYHSSKLTGKTAKGKRVLVVGGGASAVEALEFVVHTEAKSTSVLARSDKWIIPRNVIVDVLLAFNIFGQPTLLSGIPEWLLKKFFYRDLADLAPDKESVFTGTPMVNSDVFRQIRRHKADWQRGDILGFTETGIRFNQRPKGVPKGGPGREVTLEGDMVIMATGYQRPSLRFLPQEVFEDNYSPPNWYLQVFPPKHISICANNCTYVNAIGTVGNYHIGIYTRFLLMFLVDPLARPSEWWMKKWIDMTRFLKQRAPIGAFDFFTYSELIYWFVFTVLFNPFRWKWAPFVLFGVGSALPMGVVRREDYVREKLGVNGYEQSFI